MFFLSRRNTEGPFLVVYFCDMNYRLCVCTVASVMCRRKTNKGVCEKTEIGEAQLRNPRHVLNPGAQGAAAAG